MKKILSLTLSAILLLGAIFAVPFTVSAETEYLYSNIDFTEDLYQGTSHIVKGSTLNDVRDVEVIDDADATNGKAMKFAYLRNGSSTNRKYAKCFRIIDETGTGAFILKNSTTYKITFDVKVVSGPSSVYVAAFLVNHGTVAPNQDHTSRTSVSSTTTSYTTKSITVTAPESGSIRALIGVYNTSTSSSGDKIAADVRISNIVISEQTTISYGEGIDTTGLPTAAQAYQNYEDVLVDLEDENFAGWYLDENFTEPATGTINATNVTLYAKFNEPVVNYYNHIDFTETAYQNTNHIVSTVNNGVRDVEVIDDAEATSGKAMKFAYLRNSNNKKNAKCFRIVNEAGKDAFILKNSTTYKITFDAKYVSGPNTIRVGAYLMTDGAISPGDDPVAWTGNITNTSYAPKNFNNTITTPADGTVRVLIGVYNNASEDGVAADVRISNLVIAEQTTISYGEGIDTTDLPTTAWANQTYEDALVDLADENFVGWYLDPEFTTEATGIINAVNVTLYAKIIIPVEFEQSLLLFNNGDANELADEQGYAMGINSVIYTHPDGSERTAFRFAAKFKYYENGDGNIYADEACTRKILRRGMKVGVVNGDEYDQKDASETSATEAAWKIDTENKTIQFTYLMFNISKTNKDQKYYAVPYLVLEYDGIDGEIVFELPVMETSVQEFYDTIKVMSGFEHLAGYTWYTDESAAQ